MRATSHCVLALVFMVSWNSPSRAQEFNYDESKVPRYTLPDPLLRSDGKRVESAREWRAKRRPEILQLFESTVYGQRPSEPAKMEVVNATSANHVLGGNVTRKMLTLRCSRGSNSIDLHLLVYLPQKGARPVPAFVGLNFGGNHTIADDPQIPVTSSWVRNDARRGITDHRATEKMRGTSSSRWPVQQIVARGYAVATIYCGDIDPDTHDGFHNGVHALYEDENRTAASWGTINAWAWGVSRAMDYFEQDPDIDQEHVAVMGHSRLGKTSLWAGASDERFALVVSNDSGCGGAALSRRRFGETVKRINTSFPHWFCDNFKKYNDRESELPVDQHMLVALMAPRPVLICSAQEDGWADPRGEFLAGKGADPVYRLLGTDGLDAEDMPAVNTPISSRIGYHIRPGRHDVKPEDWTVYMDFADKHFDR